MKKVPAEQHDFERIDLKGHVGRRGRLFESGKMKILVLHLISQQPKHGYEIIKEIGDLVGGGYSPSAGTIYPTLSWLEEMGYVLAEKNESDRKQYHVTKAGQLHLQDQKNQLDVMLERLETRREIHDNDRLLDIYRAMENLKTALRLKLKANDYDAEQVRQIAARIDQAAVEIGCL